MKTPCRIKIHFSFLKQREKFSQFPFSFHPIEGETSTDFNPQKKNNRASSIPLKSGSGFRVYVKREMKIIYFGQRSGSRSRPIVAATEGCGLRGGEGVSCRMEIREWLGIDESPIHRHPLSTFLSIYRVGYGAGLLPR